MCVWFVYVYLHVGVVCLLCVCSLCVLLVCVLYMSMAEREQIERRQRSGRRKEPGRQQLHYRKLKQASKCHCYLGIGPHVAQVGEELVEANDDRELLLFLFPPLGCLYYKPTGHYKPSTSCMLSNDSNNWVMSPASGVLKGLKWLAKLLMIRKPLTHFKSRFLSSFRVSQRGPSVFSLWLT